MKRILIILLVICLAGATVAGCAGEDLPTAPEEYAQVNFNNTLLIRPDFYFFDEGCFYARDGFYNMGVYRNRAGKPEKLFAESDFPGWLDDFIVCGSELYFVMTDGDSSWLYRYDLKTDTHEQLYPIANPEYMGVLGEFVVYQDRSDPKKQNLRFLDLRTGEDRIAMEGIEVFGLVDGEVRCVVRNEGYEVYRVDPLTGGSELLGTFSVDQEGSYAYYSFASEHVLMRLGNSGGTCWSFSLVDGTVTAYTVPKKIHEMVAGDDAVFLLVYEEERYTSAVISSPENGVYRVDLTDGSCEQVYADVDDQTKIYVESDDGIYLKHSNTVYRLDLNAGTCEKVFRLKRVFRN